MGASTLVRVFEPFEIVLDLPPELDPLRQSRPASSAHSSPPAASAPVSLDAGVYAEILRCFSALAGACREAPAGQVPVTTITDQVLARWERLRPKLPRVLPARKEGAP